MDLDLLINKYFDKAISILDELISKKSILDNNSISEYAPFGDENKKALDKFIEIGNNYGFKTYNHNNYFGFIEYGEGNDIFAILSHLDVVPVNLDEWNTNPFKLSIKDNILYGRGVTDDKGPLVAALIALIALKDEGFIPSIKIRLIAGCDEETESRCIKEYKKIFGNPKFGFSPDADFPLINGEKAIMSYDIEGEEDNILTYASSGERYNIVPSKCEFKLSIDLKKEFYDYLKMNNYKGKIIDDKYIFYGVASHAMEPNLGLNAIYIMFDFLSKYTNFKLLDFIKKYYLWDNEGKMAGYYDEDLIMGKLTSNLAIFNLNNKKFKLGFNVRAPHDESFNNIPKILNEKLKIYGYNYKRVYESKSHYVDANSNIVKTLLDVYNDIAKDYKKPITIGGGTYAREFDNVVAYGPQLPNTKDVCHISNEYMTIDNFKLIIKIYYKAIKELSK